MYVHENYGPKAIYISENGMATRLESLTRMARSSICSGRAYYVDHIEQMDSARQKGVPVKGYFAWTLIDNFEWAYGYTVPFGIVHVDYRHAEADAEILGGNLPRDHPRQAVKPVCKDQIDRRGPGKGGVVQALPGQCIMVFGHAVVLAQRQVATGDVVGQGVFAATVQRIDEQQRRRRPDRAAPIAVVAVKRAGQRLGRQTMRGQEASAVWSGLAGVWRGLRRAGGGQAAGAGTTAGCRRC